MLEAWLMKNIPGGDNSFETRLLHFSNFGQVIFMQLTHIGGHQKLASSILVNIGIYVKSREEFPTDGSPDRPLKVSWGHYRHAFRVIAITRL